MRHEVIQSKTRSKHARSKYHTTDCQEEFRPNPLSRSRCLNITVLPLYPPCIRSLWYSRRDILVYTMRLGIPFFGTSWFLDSLSPVTTIWFSHRFFRYGILLPFRHPLFLFMKLLAPRFCFLFPSVLLFVFHVLCRKKKQYELRDRGIFRRNWSLQAARGTIILRRTIVNRTKYFS